MTDDIRALTARLAEEPGSLAFLELAEALRRRGQLDAAYNVARGGLTRYPGLADAHDLMARVLSDQDDLAGAFDAWASALQLDPMRTSALKGIAFLYFRAGDPAAALNHLERALEVDPDDASIRQALARVSADTRRPAAAASGSPHERPDSPPEPTPARATAEDSATRAGAPGPFDHVDNGSGLLLIDASGLRLAGRLAAANGDAGGDRAAAQLAGVSREAARATRLLKLGAWHAIAVESPDGHLVLTQASADTVVLAVRDPSLPLARVTMLAERAGRSARAWLEAQG
ncbi:MAG: tetratricopeptide repeat protein [Gemmatimonadales bacterium]